MNTRNIYRWLLLAILLCGVTTPLLAQSLQPPSSADDPLILDNPQQGRTIGAPQVLEIPPAQETPPLPDSSLPPADTAALPPSLPHQTEIPLNQSGPNLSGSPSEAPVPHAASRRNYLGVLYATSEEGQAGVKVLDVVQGSPADRAGFQGMNRPSEQQSNFVKAAIVVLAMSPAGPFAIPLAIAHDMYMSRHSPGDLIVAVDGRPVRDAQEFSEEMRRYQPNETVSFSVIRAGKPLQITVQLEEEPT